jgi:hypothetical protein
MDAAFLKRFDRVRSDLVAALSHEDVAHLTRQSIDLHEFVLQMTGEADGGVLSNYMLDGQQCGWQYTVPETRTFEDRTLRLLEPITPHPISFKLEPLPPLEVLAEERWIGPWVFEGDAEQKKMFVKKFSGPGRTYGSRMWEPGAITFFSNQIVILYVTFGAKRVTESKMLGILKYYLKKSKIDANGLWQHSKKSMEPPLDILAGIRIQMLIELAWREMEYQEDEFLSNLTSSYTPLIDVRVHASLLEFAQFVFPSPHSYANKLKTAFGVVELNVFIGSTEGDRIQYPASASTFRNHSMRGTAVKMSEETSDLAVYYAVEAELIEALEGAKELPNLYMLLKGMYTAPINKDTIQLSRYITSILASTGYGASDINAEIRQTGPLTTPAYTDLEDRREGYDDYPIVEELAMIWRDMMTDTVRIGAGLRNGARLFSTFLTYMTSKSAGEPESVSVPLPEGGSFKSTSKIVTGLVHFTRWANAGPEEPLNDPEHPIKPGTRRVTGGKEGRIVFPVNFMRYILEVIMYLGIIRNTVQKPKEGLAFRVYEAIMAGSNRGDTSDDLPWMVTSGSNDAFIGADASRFDGSCGPALRMAVYNGIKTALIQTGMWDTRFGRVGKAGGRYGTYGDIVDRMFHAVGGFMGYYVRAVDPIDGSIKPIMYQTLGSGELGTSTMGSCVSYALVTYMIKVMSETSVKLSTGVVRLSNIFKATSRRVLGDDVAVVLKRIGRKYKLKDEVLVMRALFNVTVTAYKENGFEVNVVKTVLGLNRANFLKRAYVAGFYVPRDGLVRFSTEMGTRPEASRREDVSSFKSKILTVVSRGLSFRSSFLATMAFAMIKMLHDTGPFAPPPRVRVKPTFALYLPGTLGGFALLPNSPAPSNDALLAYLHSINPTYYRAGNIYGTMYTIAEKGKTRTRLRDAYANALRRGSRVQGTRHFLNFTAKLRNTSQQMREMLPERTKRQSLKAAELLRGWGTKGYRQLGHEASLARRITEIIDTAANTRLHASHHFSNADKYLIEPTEVKDLFIENHPWSCLLSIQSEGYDYKVDREEVHAFYHLPTHDLYRAFGHPTEVGVVPSLIRRADRLIRNGDTFVTDLPTERIIELLVIIAKSTTAASDLQVLTNVCIYMGMDSTDATELASMIVRQIDVLTAEAAVVGLKVWVTPLATTFDWGTSSLDRTIKMDKYESSATESVQHGVKMLVRMLQVYRVLCGHKDAHAVLAPRFVPKGDLLNTHAVLFAHGSRTARTLAMYAHELERMIASRPEQASVLSHGVLNSRF